MTQYTLTVLDTSRIQRYVFGSNRLQENVGGSQLVELATHQWVYEALPPMHNVADLQVGTLDPAKTIDRVDAEVIYAGGGNTVILFKSLTLAHEFTRRLTRRVLIDAPGLELVVAHRPIDWDSSSLALAVQETLGRDLARKKQNRQPSLPLLGLSVTTACNSTGLVAVGVNDRGQPISREIKAKLSEPVQSSARERLLALLPDFEHKGWEIPRDLDDMGRIRGEESYLAVVHADGNGMGQRVQRVAGQYQQPGQNRKYIQAIRSFSEAVQTASKKALQAAVDLLAEALKRDRDLPASYPYFPFRPIVFGGDDITFVCNGRYGLPLAVRYLQEFEKQTAEQPAFGGEPAHACAGVAVAKVHYPFARAYRLSKTLCHSAKVYVKEEKDHHGDCSALDWHFAMSGITGSLKAIRQRQYEVNLGHSKPGKLYMRPVLLAASSLTWRSWPIFITLAREFAAEDGEWYDRRNKVKALLEALRVGPEAVKEFRRTYRLDTLPKAKLIPVAGSGETGWDGWNRCVYFDPVEAMDFYTDLEDRIDSSGSKEG